MFKQKIWTFEQNKGVVIDLKISIMYHHILCKYIFLVIRYKFKQGANMQDLVEKIKQISDNNPQLFKFGVIVLALIVVGMLTGA